MEDKKYSKKIHEAIPGPSVAVDTVLFSIIKNQLCTLLIQINSGTYKNLWAIPGGLVNEYESLENAAQRILKSKTNISEIYLEQLNTFGDPKRDKRGHVISVSYYSVIFDHEKFKLHTLPYYNDIKWFPVNILPKLAFDHKAILDLGILRLRSKMQYTNIAYNFLPIEFTLTDIQKVYETVLGQDVDKRNFRKKIENLDILEESGNVKSDVAYRPAKLYKFKRRYLEILE